MGAGDLLCLKGINYYKNKVFVIWFKIDYFKKTVMWEATDFNEFPSSCAAKVEWSRQRVRAWSTREAVHRSEARRMSVSEVRKARRREQSERRTP